MTMRERMKALIHLREMDRVPFVQYNDLSAPDEEVWSLVGRENMGVIRWTYAIDSVNPNCRTHTEPFQQGALRGQRTTLVTPVGTLTQEQLQEPALGTWATRKHFVTEPAHYEMLLAYLRDMRIVENFDQFREDDRLVGDDGIAMVVAKRTPYQRMWSEFVSLEHLCVHMVEHDIVEECLSELARICRDIYDIIGKAIHELDIDVVDISDNITAPAIGPRYFEKYCTPQYQYLADILAKKDIPLFVHTDGDLRPLWTHLVDAGVRGLDSLSPPPDNDTSAADAAALHPEMRMWLNYPSSVHLAEPDTIYATTMEILEQAGHTGRLQIQISENVPPEMWRKSYPPIIRAIRDFGKP
jgi:hypothetical protein